MNIVEYKKINEKKVLFIFDNGDRRSFCIDRMLMDDIPQAQQYRWKKMFENGLFYSNLYISQGEPVWEGWVELIDDEVIKYTEEYKEGLAC